MRLFVCLFCRSRHEVTLAWEWIKGFQCRGIYPYYRPFGVHDGWREYTPVLRQSTTPTTTTTSNTSFTSDTRGTIGEFWSNWRQFVFTGTLTVHSCVYSECTLLAESTPAIEYNAGNATCHLYQQQLLILQYQQLWLISAVISLITGYLTDITDISTVLYINNNSGWYCPISAAVSDIALYQQPCLILPYQQPCVGWYCLGWYCLGWYRPY